MQNLRGRARMLARRHARVHFNLGSRVRPSTSHELYPDDTTRDIILKQILARIKKSERELSTCRNRTNELLNMSEDSLTAARIRHEEHLLDDLIDFAENSVDDKTKLEPLMNSDDRQVFAKRLKRDLLNWIVRNETELHEIDTLENQIMKRYAQLNYESMHLQRLFDDMKRFTNPNTGESFETMESGSSSEVVSAGTNTTQSSPTSWNIEQ